MKKLVGGRKPTHILSKKNNNKTSEEELSFIENVCSKMLKTPVTMTTEEYIRNHPAEGKQLMKKFFEKFDQNFVVAEESPSLKVNNASLLSSTQIENNEGTLEDIHYTLQRVKNPIYSAPLPYIWIRCDDGGGQWKALVDSGSMLNLVSQEPARRMGWRDQVKIDLSLDCVATQSAKLVGIVENVKIALNDNIWGYQHFFVTDGTPPLILGNPFFIDFEAHLDYSQDSVNLEIVDSRGLKVNYSLKEDEDSSVIQRYPDEQWVRNSDFRRNQSLRRHIYYNKQEDSNINNPLKKVKLN